MAITEHTSQIFGDYVDPLPEQGEYLNLGFSPSYAPLKKRWENNGLSADFISEYFRNFYISRQEVRGEEQDEMIVENIRDAVKYIANELLENAMKFQESDMPFTAKIYLSLYSDKLIFFVTNGIADAQVQSLQFFIKKLLQSDPYDLYFETMRNSAREENKNHSGLGLLSMICDYSAKIGWKFEPFMLEEREVMTVTTMVTLNT